MPPRFTVNTNEPAWLAMIDAKRRQFAVAAVATLRETAANAVQEGRQNIGAAGPGFRKAKWQSGLQYRTKNATKDGEPSTSAKAIIFHKYGIAGVFEHGPTVIHGKPMLWIPTTPGGPTASRSGKKLVSATVRGTPMMFDDDDKDRNRKPLYIGVESVTIPDKFRVTEIVKKHVAKFATLFSKHFRDK